MIGEQVDETLADETGGAENAGAKFSSCGVSRTAGLASGELSAAEIPAPLD